MTPHEESATWTTHDKEGQADVENHLHHRPPRRNQTTAGKMDGGASVDQRDPHRLRSQHEMVEGEGEECRAEQHREPSLDRVG